MALRKPLTFKISHARSTIEDWMLAQVNKNLGFEHEEAYNSNYIAFLGMLVFILTHGKIKDLSFFRKSLAIQMSLGTLTGLITILQIPLLREQCIEKILQYDRGRKLLINNKLDDLPEHLKQKICAQAEMRGMTLLSNQKITDIYSRFKETENEPLREAIASILEKFTVFKHTLGEPQPLILDYVITEDLTPLFRSQGK